MKLIPKIHELYVSKKVTISLPYRGKTRSIVYTITSVSGTEYSLDFGLRAIRYPCEIPRMESISINLKNEFPTKEQLKALKKLNKFTK